MVGGRLYQSVRVIISGNQINNYMHACSLLAALNMLIQIVYETL